MKKQPTPHLVIVDALNLIRRIDGALRGFSGHQTLDIQQLIAMTEQALGRIIRGHQPSHIIAVFDGDGNNWRKKLYPKYKENRKPMAPDLADQLPNIQQKWQLLGVKSLLTQHEEADDLIATLSTKMRASAGKVTIISTDQGFSQLIPIGVNIWDHFASEWQGEEKIYQKFGISSKQLLDYWSIVGQSGNKIPGVSGLGPKAATAILNQFGNLTTAFSAPSDPDNKQLVKLQNAQEQARLSYSLVKLKADIDLGITLGQFRFIQPH